MSKVIILAYADDEAAPLENLEREHKAVYDYLQLRHGGDINVRPLKKAKFKDVLDEFRTYSKDIILFHFSGHAGQEKLLFEDNAARAAGLHALLELAPQLELVFLNGCATYDQVGILHGDTDDETKGVKRIIATSREVFDETAADFAIYFYSALCTGWSVGSAFDFAKSFVLTGDQYKLFPTGTARHIFNRAAPGATNDFPWGIYYKQLKGKPATEDYKSLDDYTLPERDEYIQDDAPYKPNIELIKTIGSKGKIIYKSLTELKKSCQQPGIDDEIREFEELEGLYNTYMDGGDFDDITDLANRTVNMLPKPLGSLLRQMICTAIEIRDKKKNSFENLLDLQLRFYSTMVKLCCFTMMSDLFNMIDSKESVTINKVQHQYLMDFFSITESAKDEFDYVSLFKIIREIIEKSKLKAFITESLELKNYTNYESRFFDSHMLIRGIIHKRQQKKLSGSLMANCQKVEGELVNIFDFVFFILRYKLLVIKNVEAIRTRTVAKRSYTHRVILLRQDITNMLKEKELPTLEDYTETHSVIVVRGLYRIIDFLSLSPFVIDRNVLTDDNSSELYFYSHVSNGIFFESIEDDSRKLEIECIEKSKISRRDGVELMETRTEIPFVEKLPDKSPYEKVKITSRLMLIKDQFTYMKNKVAKMKLVSDETTAKSDNPQTIYNGSPDPGI